MRLYVVQSWQNLPIHSKNAHTPWSMLKRDEIIISK